MSDDKEEAAEDHVSWLSHPYTRKMIPETQKRLDSAIDMLIGTCLTSSDPRVTLQAATIMSMRQTLQSLKGEDRERTRSDGR